MNVGQLIDKLYKVDPNGNVYGYNCEYDCYVGLTNVVILPSGVGLEFIGKDAPVIEESLSILKEVL